MAPVYFAPQITGQLEGEYRIRLASTSEGAKTLDVFLNVDRFNLFDVTFHVTIAGAVKTFNSLPSAVRHYDSAGKP
jgi:hypothetical protein